VSSSGCAEKAISKLKIEAEEMDYTIYEIEEKRDYSGGKGLMINKETNAFMTGTADYTFTGLEGTYNIEITYVDEEEPLAPVDKRYSKYTLGVLRGKSVLKTDTWIANKRLGFHSINKNTLTDRHITGVVLKPGDIIRIEGTATGGEHAEHARLDCMVIAPAGVSTIAE